MIWRKGQKEQLTKLTVSFVSIIDIVGIAKIIFHLLSNFQLTYFNFVGIPKIIFIIISSKIFLNIYKIILKYIIVNYVVKIQTLLSVLMGLHQMRLFYKYNFSIHNNNVLENFLTLCCENKNILIL